MGAQSLVVADEMRHLHTKLSGPVGSPDRGCGPPCNGRLLNKGGPSTNYRFDTDPASITALSLAVRTFILPLFVGPLGKVSAAGGALLESTVAVEEVLDPGRNSTW
jgi:hypothetical protein